MPKRHCAIIKGVDRPQWRLGIWQIFDPWVDPHLQALQGHTSPAKTQPLTIEFHFRHVVHRLVRSLGRLHKRVQEWNSFLETGGLAGPHPELAFEIPEEGGIAADSVFHYLNLFIDDLARIVPFVLTEEGSKPKEPDGFSGLKKMLVKGEFSASRTLSELFTELDCETSWWSLGFKWGLGMRQLLTHYTTLVYFHGSTKAGDTKMSGDVSLTTVGGPICVVDFENALKKLLRDFCEWLDRLDQELLAHLSEKLKKKGISWNPSGEPCPTVVLPEEDEVRLDASHYLYLPV